jgi:hypothetical protein
MLSLVALACVTAVMTAATPMMTPSIVKHERRLLFIKALSAA